MRYLLFLVVMVAFNCNPKEDKTNKEQESKIDVVDTDGYLNRDTNTTEKGPTKIQVPTSTSTSAWDTLKASYDKALKRLDPILNATPKLQQQPSELLLKIRKQISKIREMLDEKNPSDAEVTRKMIADLNQLIDQLESSSLK